MMGRPKEKRFAGKVVIFDLLFNLLLHYVPA